MRHTLLFIAMFGLVLTGCPDPKSPTLEVSTTAMSLSTSPFQGTFVIRNTGTKVLTWSVASSAAWLTATPSSGTVDIGSQTTVTVQANVSGLPAGANQGVLTVNSDGGTAAVTVTATLTPQLSVPTTTISITASSGQKTFTLANTGNASLTWSLSSNASWLTATPSSGTIAAGASTTVTATASLTGITCTTCSGTLAITSNGGSGSVAVSMRVVTVKIVNQLVNAVNVFANGVSLGSVSAQSIGTSTPMVGGDSLFVRLGVVRSTAGGSPIGDSITVSYASITNPAGTITDTLGNQIGSNYIFQPVVTNNTTTRLLMTVNAGTSSENKCNCVVPASTSNVGVGYYVYVAGGQVRGYRDGSNYTGNYIYWTFTTANLATGTGLLSLVANTAPTAEFQGPVAGQMAPAANSGATRSGSNARLEDGAPPQDRALPPLPSVRLPNAAPAIRRPI